MPSTTSTSSLMPLPSSTVMTPSSPTFCMASAICLPIASSLFALMVPTWVMILKSPLTLIACFSRLVITAATAASMPRLSSSGLAPAVTALRPWMKIASASTVAVVVPSPAWVPVLEATSRTRRAPMFSNWSRNSICSATVTPSLVTWGVPQLLLMTTLRPEGPRVALTVRASFSTPERMRSRTSSVKMICLAAMGNLL